MTDITKNKVRLAEIQKELDTLATGEEAPDLEAVKKLTEERSEVHTRILALEAAQETTEEEVVESTPDGEAKELFGLVTRARVGNYLERAASGRALDGAEAELNTGLKLEGGDRMPLAMLLDPVEERQTEDRADTATNLTVNTVQRPEAWLPRVFEGTATQHLGVARKSVSGLAAFPVIGSGVTAKTVGKGDAKDAETLGLTVETLDPKRISARYLFSKEDAARLGPSTFENALRSDMRMSLTTQMDDELINGADDGNATLIEGLLEAVTPKTIKGATDAAITDASTGKEIADGILGLIDGRYAMQSTDLKYICNPALFAHMKTLGLAIGTTDHVPLEAWLQMEKVMGMAAGHIGEIANQAGESYIIISRARGRSGAACHAVWDSVEIVRDPFTSASKGEVALTLCMLHNFKVLRDDNFLVRRVART